MCAQIKNIFKNASSFLPLLAAAIVVLASMLGYISPTVAIIAFFSMWTFHLWLYPEMHRALYNHPRKVWPSILFGAVYTAGMLYITKTYNPTFLQIMGWGSCLVVVCTAGLIFLLMAFIALVTFMTRKK